jgi:uncharacterized membrane protein YcfT
MAGQTDRLSWVDTAKGLSIILVVMMHSAYGVGEETGQVGILHWIIAWATPFRMPEFFLISGLFLSQVIARDWRRFADRRVLHYFYFYALWAVLQIVFKVGLGTGDPLGALQQIAFAVVDPYGVLWFIYMLAVFSLMTKVLWDLRVNSWVALGIAALLQIAPIGNTGSYIVDQFAEYFVYFFAGYALAPWLFKAVAWAAERVPLALGLLAIYGIGNGLLVFNGGFDMQPVHAEIGYAGLPVVHLVLALLGSLALCVASALLARLAVMDWLRWLGAHSIVVYLSFSIPMALSRVVLLKLGIVDDTSLLSIAVMLSALLAPLVLYWLVEKTGWGKFLFERPAWAHLPGTPGSRTFTAKARIAAAE